MPDCTTAKRHGKAVAVLGALPQTVAHKRECTEPPGS